MTTELMRNLLTNDEKITIEYKTCQHGIQADVYETVCSFSNRYGGYIIMGVEDDGTPIGTGCWSIEYLLSSIRSSTTT